MHTLDLREMLSGQLRILEHRYQCGVRGLMQSDQPPIVDPSLTGRERDIALEAKLDFEPTIKHVFLAISAMSKNIVVRDDIRAEIAEALQHDLQVQHHI